MDYTTVPRREPWLGREMAGETQTDLWIPTAALGRFREDPHPSRILRTRSERGHLVGQLYHDMVEKDLDLAAVIKKRADAVLNLPRRVEPIDGSPLALELAGFCRRALERIPALAINLRHQIERSLADGIALDELNWAQLDRGEDARAWVPVEMWDRPMWRFAFRQGELHVRRRGGEPIEAPAGKFLVMRSGSKDGPWGRGLLDQCYWYWYIKLHVAKFWAVFVEKWAMPTPIGRYDAARGGGDKVAAAAADKESQGKLLRILQAIQTEQGVVIPKGLEVSLLEATRSGSVSYESFYAALRRGYLLLWLGEVGTSGGRPGTGSFASDEVGNEIRVEKRDLDAHDLGANIRDQFFRPLVAINYGLDALPLCPRFVVDVLGGADLKMRREGHRAVLDRGLPVPRSEFYLVHQTREPLQGEEVVVREASPAPAAPTPAAAPEPEPEPAAAAAARVRATLAARRRPGALAAADDTEPTAEDEAAGALAAAEARQAALDELSGAFMPGSLAYYERHQELVLAAFDRLQLGAESPDRLTAETALPWLADRLLPEAQAHAENLLGACAHAAGMALRDLLDDGVPEAVWTISPATSANPSTASAATRPGRVRLAAGLPPGATAANRWKTAADYWARLLNLQKAIFEGLEDAHRRFAFTIAGVEDAALLADANRLVQEAIASGMDREDFVARLGRIYEDHGVAPTSDWHARLVYDQAVRQANAALRWQQTVGNPAAHALLPYLEWFNLDQERVRNRPQHNHQVMGGRVFAIGHEIWRTWAYPAGFNCRCYTGSINKRAALRRGLTGAEPTGPWPIDPFSGERALPDPGFRAAADLGQVSEAVDLPRLKKQLEAAQAQQGAPGGGGLVAALRALLKGLLGFDPFELFGL